MARLLALSVVWTMVSQVGLAGQVHAGTRVGRLDILADVHGYNTGGRVLVPLRGIAEWLGAEVRFDSPTIRVVLGDREVRLQLNSATATVNGKTVRLDVPARAYGGITCVPVRFISEALGVKVQYNPPRGLVWPAHVVLETNRQRGRVLVHHEPPNVVAEVVADLENTVQTDAGRPDTDAFRYGAYGTDWIIEVGKMHSGYFGSIGPMVWVEAEDTGFTEDCFLVNAWGVYGRRRGKWRWLTGGNDAFGRSDWVRAGIPISVAHQLGVRFAYD